MLKYPKFVKIVETWWRVWLKHWKRHQSFALFYSVEVKYHKSLAVDMTCSSQIHMEQDYHDGHDAQDKQDGFRSLQTI